MDKGTRTQRMGRRIVAVFYVLFWVFLLLAARLFQVQVVQARHFGKLAQDEHTERIPIPAVRGRILDRHGEVWAMSLVGHSVAAFPSKISNKEEISVALAQILGIRSSTILKEIRNTQSFMWIARKIDLEKAARVKSLKLPGIEVVEEPTGKRFYPRGKLACHVLGYTGIDDQGLDGVEVIYDKELRGTPGYFLAETDGLGRVLPDGVWKVVPATPGGDITLTLDEGIQYVAERELARGVKKSHAKGGSVIVMDPETGGILALANVPNFDGGNLERTSPAALRNQAISDDYEPGSTFKGILAAAALESGKVTRSDKFLSGPSIQVDGWTLHNAEDGYRMSSQYQNIDEIITNSLNVGAASIGLKIGTESFADMISRCGFFKKTGIDLPGEADSLIANPRDWKKIDLATIAFGQGISVTPIQMIAAYAAIANGGIPVHPHVREPMSVDGKPVSPESRRSASEGGSILSLQTDAVLKDLLSRVVEKGTGTNAAVPGYSTAGKTGTAQISERGGFKSGAYVASFIGFVPVEKPALVILVKVEEPQFPYWGGTVAAPIFKAVAQEALWAMRIPPSEPMKRFGAWQTWESR